MSDSVFRVPLILAVIVWIGLVTALLVEGTWDHLLALTLVLPIVVVAWALMTRRVKK